MTEAATVKACVADSDNGSIASVFYSAHHHWAGNGPGTVLRSGCARQTPRFLNHPHAFKHFQFSYILNGSICESEKHPLILTKLIRGLNLRSF